MTTANPYDVAAKAAERALTQYSASNAPIGSARGDVVLALHALPTDERAQLGVYVGEVVLHALVNAGLYVLPPAEPAPNLHIRHRRTHTGPGALVLRSDVNGRAYPVGEIPTLIHVDRELWDRPPAEFASVEGDRITFDTVSGPLVYEVLAVLDDGTRACFRAAIPEQPAVVIIDEAHRLPREDGRDAGFLPDHGPRKP